ncbi:hypothetical protein M438DRAFT_151186 [Aureobasidium pullulans EXF-150]|uniref:Uncharacterized protein n=1 Tax=Aureobasidium pullulans EXF-150 TaxID=1043002 RepID=A0A074X1K3_AURPU|nr:uncharacterized protein M438DRAFT_151186 [Aureobasidium pullulans EXF-150]KEQ79345.1 hypothetical protein M438DRAFT_151186 [Aureobasidium pullulans EXF-150]
MLGQKGTGFLHVILIVFLYNLNIFPSRAVPVSFPSLISYIICVCYRVDRVADLR